MIAVYVHKRGTSEMKGRLTVTTSVVRGGYLRSYALEDCIPVRTALPVDFWGRHFNLYKKLEVRACT